MSGEAAAEAAFNELIHAPKRLRICAMLAGTAAVEFATLRESLQVSDSVLSKHLSVLEEAGYLTTRRELAPLTTRRGAQAARLRLWASLTPAGSRAYVAHVRALRRITGEAE